MIQYSNLLSRRITLLVFCLFTYAQVFCQVDSLYSDTSPIDWTETQDSLFQNIDLSNVNSGILLERGMHFINPLVFDGSNTSETAKSFNDLRQVHLSLLTSAMTSIENAPALLEQWIDSTSVLDSVYEIAILAYDVNRIALPPSDTDYRNIFDYQSGRLVDITANGIPFVNDTITIASSYQTNIEIEDSSTLQFVIPSSWMHTNMGDISRLYYDFGALGADSVQPDEVFSINPPVYSSGLIGQISFNVSGKRQIASFKIDLTYTNKSVLLTNYNLWDMDTVYIQNTENPEYGAEVFTAYGCGHENLVRPLIVVEGFNPPEFRDLNIIDWYYDIVFVDKPNYGSDININQFLESGYDIVYVDFDQGDGDILENARTLQYVIDWVNENKIQTNSEFSKNVVLGHSIGGLIGMYALRDMEISGRDHDTRTFVTWDSPLLGANIPVSIQAMVEHLRHAKVTVFGVPVVFMTTYAPQLLDAYRVLHRPASKQILRYSFHGYSQLHGNNWAENFSRVNLNDQKLISNEYSSFMTQVHQNGLPQLTERNIAFSNGNSEGIDQGFPSLGVLFKADCRSNCLNGVSWALGLKYDIYAKATPGYSSNNYPVYDGRIWSNLLSFMPPIYAAKRLRIHLKECRPYDNSPGGRYTLSDFGFDANDLPLKYNELEEGFSFIPTVSGLNISSELSNPFYNFYNQNLVSLSKTDFDEVYHFDGNLYTTTLSPDENENHTDFSPSFSLLFENELGGGNSVSELVNKSILDEEGYNYGASPSETTSNIHSSSLTVKGSSTKEGVLCINCATNIGYDNEVNRPNSSVNNFDLEVNRGCNSTSTIISIEDKGALEIGSSSSQSASVHFMNGTRLEIKSGGTLRIKENSKLVIHEGAVIKLESGNSILIEDNGELVIKGKIILDDDARLLINEGTLVLDQEVPFTGGQLDFVNHYEFGNNTKIRVVGSGSNRPKIKVLKSGYFRDAFANTPEVRLINTDVEILQGELFFLYNDPFINNVSVDVLDGIGLHKGLRIWGDNGTTVIKNSSIKNGETGLWAHWLTATNPIQIHNCSFEDNSVSLLLEGGSMSIYDSDFTTNGWVSKGDGIIGSSIQGNSTIRNCTFLNLENGLLLNGTSNTSLDSRNNTIGCEKVGMSIERITASVKCNTIHFNQVGVLIKEQGILNIDYSSDNVFMTNNIAIRFADNIQDPSSCGLFLKNGGNQFILGGLSATGQHIYGAFTNMCALPTIPPSVPYVQSIYAPSVNMTTDLIDATGNYVEYREIYSDQGHCCVYELPVSISYYNGAQPISTNLCETMSISGHSTTNDIITNCSLAVGNSHPLVHTLQFVNGSGGDIQGIGDLKSIIINSALLMSYGDTIGDDVTAFHNLHTAAVSTILNTDGFTNFLQELAHITALTALENAYHSGQLASNEGEIGQIPDSAMNLAISMIDYRLTLLDSMSDGFSARVFNNRLNKVLVFRNGGYTEQALAELQNASSWLDSLSYEQTQRINYWQCVISKEHDYFQNLLTKEQFSQAYQQCKQQYHGFDYKSNQNIGVEHVFTERSNQMDYMLYPQPVSGGSLNIQFKGNLVGGKAAFRLYSMEGVLLRTGELQLDESNIASIEIQELSTGAYILAVNNGIGEKRKVFLVE